MAAKKTSKKLRQGKRVSSVKPLTTHKDFSFPKHVDHASVNLG